MMCGQYIYYGESMAIDVEAKNFRTPFFMRFPSNCPPQDGIIKLKFLGLPRVAEEWRVWHAILRHQNAKLHLAERVGFEPTVQLPVHMISSHADSASSRISPVSLHEQGKSISLIPY